MARSIVGSMGSTPDNGLNQPAAGQRRSSVSDEYARDWPGVPERGRSAETARLAIVIACVVLCGCRRQVFSGGSMEPTIKRGERVSVDYAAYLLAKPKRWDVVAFEPPNFTNQIWI